MCINHGFFKKKIGFEATKNIKVIMATNRIDILDPALVSSNLKRRKYL